MEEEPVLENEMRSEIPRVSEKEGLISEKDSRSKLKRTTKPTISPSSNLLTPTGAFRRRTETVNASQSSASFTKQTTSFGKNPGLHTVRRNSTGGLPIKSSVTEVQRNAAGGTDSNLVRRSTPEIECSLLSGPSIYSDTSKRKSVTGLRPGQSASSVSSPDFIRGRVSGSPSFKNRPSSSSFSSIKRPSSPAESTASSVNRKTISSTSVRSPSFSSGLRSGSLSEKRSNVSGRRQLGTPDSRDSRFIVLPQVESKGGDEVRLDLRGHRVRSLNGLNLSPNLEFLYLRDNLLSTVEGIEILTRVKVLDLSFNEFKGPSFEPLGNCKFLQQLYLAGNQITSLGTLPVLPNLEFLSVAQNKLKTLAMASQPRLQVLAASRNKITTLKGFPYLPVLEHLRVEENPILKMSHLEAACILLIGPTLKKFNDRDLSPKELSLAKRYPACTALCIREGWEFSRPETAADSTFLFFSEQWKESLPPGYILKDAAVDKPSEEDACRCHFTFSQDETLMTNEHLVLRYQWYIGDGPLATFSVISDATEEVYFPKHEDIDKLLKVECTPVLNHVEYTPIFAISSRVSRGSGIPKVVSLEVHGDLVEGNVIMGNAQVAWCGGTPAKGVASWLRRRWNGSPVVIPGAEDEQYQLTLDDVGSSLVFMYTPVTEEDARGESTYKYTDFIKAAPPSVFNVHIIGDVVEGNTIKGVGDYFGGREGASKFEWLREDKVTGTLESVLSGTTDYLLTKEDVGQRLAFVYVPINLEGLEGESVSTLSCNVKQAPPRVTNVRIFGDLKENSKVTVSGCVTGGTEVASKVQWFMTYSTLLNGENELDPLGKANTAKALRIPLGAVGHYIVAKYTPMNPEGEAGLPVFAISERTVETLPPSLNFLSITGDCMEGEILTASYGYLGGHEGKSIYNWYLHEIESESRALIPEGSGLLQFVVGKNSVGKSLSFECIPVRDDGIIGEPKVCMLQERIRPGSPRLLALHIVGDAVEGTTIKAEKQYWGGEEGDSIFTWHRVSQEGLQFEIPGATTASYELSFEDIGCFISNSCEPVRSDWTRGTVAQSNKIGPILPGNPTCKSLEFLGSLVEGQRLSFLASYTGGIRGACSNEWFRVKPDGGRLKLSSEEFIDLSLLDVGHCIELMFTPVRHDGVKGSSKKIVSNVVAPADPVGLELSFPICVENKELVPHKRYFGGEEGSGEYVWYRTQVKLHGSALLDIAKSSDDVVIRGKDITFTPSLEDVGFYLALCWVPTRADGKCGKPLMTLSDSHVQPALPVVSNVLIKEATPGSYHAGGSYLGGHEGASLFKWYRETLDGAVSLIDGANSTTYNVTDSDYNCRLLFSYTPVRSDSVTGEECLSKSSDIILPERPKIEMLAFSGKAVEGNTLTAVELIPKSDIQQLVWNKYKNGIHYEWFCSSSIGDDDSFEPVGGQQSCSYKIRLEDIGRCLKCECVVTDVFGRSSEVAHAVTGRVVPGAPKIDKLEIEGRGFHTNLHAVRGVYSGGKEGKSRIQWLRSMTGSPDLISIPGEVGRMYEANVDDVGYRLVAIYTPVREDGVEGQPVSVSTEPIAVELDIQKEVKQRLEIGSAKFEALCYKERKANAEGTLERRFLEVNRKRVKVVKPGSKTSFSSTEIRGTYAPPFHVEVFRSDQHRLRIMVDSENEVDLTVPSRHVRDVIVLVLRGFAHKFNSTPLHTLLKIDS